MSSEQNGNPSRWSISTLPPLYRHWQLAKLALDRGETVRYQAFGGSMQPLIRSGATVIVRPPDRDALAKGDVVLVRVNGRVYLHKVLALRPGQAQIGNNRGGVNGWTATHNIFGIADLSAGLGDTQHDQ